jgi:RHS repeat-associated protein
LSHINGDGLPDLITKDESAMFVALNTGHGFNPSVLWPGALQRPVSETANIQLGGGAYYTCSFWIPFTPLFVIFNPGADLSQSVGRREAALMDVNGDGLPDHVESTSDGSIQVALNQTGLTNKLKTVNRPLGATMIINYQRDGNTYDLPQIKWVMSRVAISDGHPGDGVDTQVTTFKYSGGKQNRYERDFYGYREVVSEYRDSSQNEVIYRTITQKHCNDSYYSKGLVESETLRDGSGRIYTETVNHYNLYDLDTGWTLVDSYPNNAMDTVFPKLTRIDRRFYEGQSYYGASSFEEFKYDKYGNVNEYIKSAGNNGQDGQVKAVISYYENQTSYIVEKPSDIQVYGNGTLMRHRTGNYDPDGNMTELGQYLENGQAQLTSFSYYSNGNLKQVTGPPNLSNQSYTITIEYDSVVGTYITKITDSFGYSSTADYNFLYGVETNSTDTNGNLMHKLYDNFGRLKQVFAPYDTNIPAVDFAYYPLESPARAVTKNKIYFDSANSETLDTVIFTDGLKRVIQTKKEGEVLPTGATTSTYGMNVTGKVIFDAMGRVSQQGQPVFQDGYQTGFFSGIPLKNATINQYDIFDRTVKVTLPDNSEIKTDYSIENGLFKTAVTDPNAKVKYSYQDVDGNTVKTVQLNTGKIITTVYDYDLLDQIIQITDAHNNITRMGYDLLGQRLRIETPDAGLVEYTYDLAGNLVKKVDSNLREKGQAINYVYDYNRLKKIDYPVSTDVEYFYGAPGAAENGAGRIIKVIDESGTTQYAYGKLGEEIKTTKDLNFLVPGHTPWKFMTQTGYDYLGRVQWIRYPDGERLDYVYDRGGQIKSVSGKKQSDTYEYVKQIGYDEFSQRVYIKYGNNVETRYTYDPYRRWLANINTRNSFNTTFQNLSYSFDRVGNVLSIENTARNTTQSFQYDDLYQLVKAQGFGDDQSKRSEYLQTFTYDTIGNITKKTSYNHLTPGEEKPNQFNYDFNYSYEGTKPHAPNRIGNWIYTYDANGNVVKKERLIGVNGNSSQTDKRNDPAQNDKNSGKDHGQKGNIIFGTEEGDGGKNPLKKIPPGQLTNNGSKSDLDVEGGGTSSDYIWNEENRLVEAKVTGNGQSTTFLYDASGARTVKRGPGGETLYVSEYYQLQNQDIITKHIFVGNTRIVSKLTHYYTYDSDYEKRNIYTYHPDHLGSSNFVSDYEGKEFEHMEYTPYGETWIDEGTNKNVIGYRFTSKELDAETGLYYFGARYLDPLTSRWMSPDPAFEKYLPERPVDDESRERNKRLPGQGVVFNPLNLSLYHYSSNNPIKYVDPDGQYIESALDALFLTLDVKDIIEKPTDPVGYICLVADVGCILLPAATGGRLAVKGIEAGIDSLRISQKESKLLTFIPILEQGNRKRGLEHIVARHWWSTGVEGVSKFAKNIGGKELKNLIKEASLSGEAWRVEGKSRVLEANLGKVIGTDMTGKETSWIRIVVDEAGKVISAYPITAR